MTDLTNTPEWREAVSDGQDAARADIDQQDVVRILTAALPHLRKLIEDQHETMLLGVIADVRAAAGVGHKPMLDELADAIGAVIRNAEREAFEKAAKVAEDEDAIEFARDLGGPLALIEISTRREIAAAIRALSPKEPT